MVLNLSSNQLTGAIPSQLGNTDFVLRDWKAAGLNVRCGVKAQLATVEEGLVVRTLGVLTPTDQRQLDTHLRKWLQL